MSFRTFFGGLPRRFRVVQQSFWLREDFRAAGQVTDRFAVGKERPQLLCCFRMLRDKRALVYVFPAVPPQHVLRDRPVGRIVRGTVVRFVRHPAVPVALPTLRMPVPPSGAASRAAKQRAQADGLRAVGGSTIGRLQWCSRRAGTGLRSGRQLPWERWRKGGGENRQPPPVFSAGVLRPRRVKQRFEPAASAHGGAKNTSLGSDSRNAMSSITSRIA